MKIFICCSKHMYGQIPPIKATLEQHGHTITLPNSYDNPQKEFEMKEVGTEEHSKWKASMLRLQKDKISENDAILVLNMDKNNQKNYLGAQPSLRSTWHSIKAKKCSSITLFLKEFLKMSF